MNYDSQELVFTVSFNRPTDYNFDTGIMKANNAAGAPQERFTYRAKSCRNVFSKGQFTQELIGSLITLSDNNSTNSTNSTTARAAPGKQPNSTAVAGSRSIKESAINTGWDDSTDGTLGIKNSAMNTGWNDSTDGTLGIKNSAINTGWDDSTNGNGIATPQPATAPEPPTSSGDINPNASDGGGEIVATPPQLTNKEY
jgi:hypothetical protein